MNVPTIWVKNPESTYMYLSELFADHPWYSFDLLTGGEFTMTNLSNGRKVQFAKGLPNSRVGLITFVSQDQDDFFRRTELITELGGTITAEVKELTPGHFSVWAKTPCEWNFGLAWSGALV